MCLVHISNYMLNVMNAVYKRDLKKRIELINWVLDNLKKSIY